MSLEILKKHRQIWQEKKILQRIYQNWYEAIINNCNAGGTTLEIGGGGGNFKSFSPEVITSDYTFCPWLDLNLDAHHLPFRDDVLDNIVVVDVLHHLIRPLHFIEEAQRVLKKKGKLILLEPFITPKSYLVYNFLHEEDVDFSPDPFKEDMWLSENEKKPFDGNMAIPTQIFFRKIEQFRKQFPGFSITTQYSDYLLYPLSGGFGNPSLVPNRLIPLVLLCEKLLHYIGLFCAYRMLVVLEKK